jgi:hypothetical protein
MSEKSFVVSAPDTKQVGDISLVLSETNSLGHDIRYYVSASSADFNKLDPKRTDAANEEAVANIKYRSMNPDYRLWFLHGREAKEATADAAAVTALTGVEEEVLNWNLPVPTGADNKPFKFKDGSDVTSWARATKLAVNAKGEARMKDGQQVEVWDPKKETEENYYDRIIAMAVAAKKFASEDVARAHWQPLAERVALEVPFDVAATERKDRLPGKLATKYKEAAAVLIVRGTAEKFVTTKVVPAIPAATWTATGDTTKMFTGKATLPNGEQIDYNVSDKDAESLGKLVKQWQDWKADQERQELASLA